MLNTRPVFCTVVGFVTCVVAVALAGPIGGSEERTGAAATTQSANTAGPTPVTGDQSPNLRGGKGRQGRPGGPPAGKPCACVCRFPAQNQIIQGAAEKAPGGGTRYSFNANVSVDCTGPKCTVSKVTYAWKHTGGTATRACVSAHDAKTLVEDVTRAGTLTLECTVTVTCSDGTTCTCTGSKTFKLKA